MIESDGEVLRIIELQAENFMRLKAVRIRPDRTLVRIEGRNAAGKSAVLNVISATIGGGKCQPDEPVRRGEKKGFALLDLGSLKIERRYTAKGGNVLEVTSPGAERPLPSPQAICEKLYNDLTFDPLAFVRMGAKEQAGVLRRLAGLDFTELDTERDRVYGERTIQNRDAKATAARVGSAPPKPSSNTAIDIRALADKQQVALAHNRMVEEALAAVDREFEAIEAAKADLATAQKRLSAAEVLWKSAGEKAKPLQLENVTDLGAEIAKAEEHNAAIIVRKQWEESSAQAKESQAIADGLNDRIEAIDAEKDRRLRAAEFPLKDLSLDVNGPTLNGIPFSQASSAEQLRTGVAIGLAQKRPARIILIRDGSLLDGENLLQLHKIAEEFDAQVFVERVAESASPSAVFIEDGEVVEQGVS